MTEFLELTDAVKKYVKPGCSVAAEGFTHLIPHAAGAEIIRQKIDHLTLIRMTPDIIFDQMIGMGCADKLVFSWGGNPGVGSLFRLRDAYENGVPHEMEFEEHAHAAMANAFAAGAAGMPCAVFKGYRGTQYPEVNPKIKFIECPFTGEQLTVIPAHRPDVAIIHAQRADRQGNIWMTGILGVQKEAVLAAAHSIVTVEEIVDEVDESSRRHRHPALGRRRGVRGPAGRISLVYRGLLRQEQRLLPEVGRNQQGVRAASIEWMEHYVVESESFVHYLAKLKEDGYV